MTTLRSLRHVAGKPCWLVLWASVFIAALLFPGPASAETAPVSAQPVVVIPVHQTIESGLESFLERAFGEAREMGAKHIVLEINTFGGRVDSAEGIGELIRESDIPTVAFVRGKAVSAGSYIALNADQIVMEPGSTIGSAAVVDIGGNLVRDPKTVAHWTSAMRSAAELNGRDPRIAEGMANPDIVVEMPQIQKTKKQGEVISLSADEALKVGYAEGIAKNLDEVLAFVKAEGHPVIEVKETVAERAARFLTNPVIMTLLLIVGLAGIAVELFVPGFGIPGILGISAFVLYFFGHYVAGFAGMEELLLFAAGIFLLIVELFVPGFGIFGGIGVICLILGIVLAAYDTQNALISLGIAFAVAAVVLYAVIRLFKHRGVWNKFILKEEQLNEKGYVSTPAKEHLVGKRGISVTPLRPAGTALIDGERVDVITDGEYIPSGRTVVVYLVEGGRVLVREIRE